MKEENTCKYCGGILLENENRGVCNECLEIKREGAFADEKKIFKIEKKVKYLLWFYVVILGWLFFVWFGPSIPMSDKGWPGISSLADLGATFLIVFKIISYIVFTACGTFKAACRFEWFGFGILLIPISRWLGLSMLNSGNISDAVILQLLGIMVGFILMGLGCKYSWVDGQNEKDFWNNW